MSSSSPNVNTDASAAFAAANAKSLDGPSASEEAPMEVRSGLSPSPSLEEAAKKLALAVPRTAAALLLSPFPRVAAERDGPEAGLVREGAAPDGTTPPIHGGIADGRDPAADSDPVPAADPGPAPDPEARETA